MKVNDSKWLLLTSERMDCRANAMACWLSLERAQKEVMACLSNARAASQSDWALVRPGQSARELITSRFGPRIQATVGFCLETQDEVVHQSWLVVLSAGVISSFRATAQINGAREIGATVFRRRKQKHQKRSEGGVDTSSLFVYRL